MTQFPQYAVNGRRLLETRRQGMRPPIVVVSLCGGDFRQPALYVRPDMPADRLDWSMLVNVEVWVQADETVPGARLLAVVAGIARARPSRLVARFDTADGQTHDVDCGSGWHHAASGSIPAAHEFLWFPIRLSLTTAATALQRALVARIPRETVL